MGIERQMGAVDGEVVFQQELKEFVAFAGPGMGWAPEESVVDDEEIGLGGDGECDGGEGGIDGGSDAGDGAVVFDLEAIEGAVVVFDVAGAE